MKQRGKYGDREGENGWLIIIRQGKQFLNFAAHWTPQGGDLRDVGCWCLTSTPVLSEVIVTRFHLDIENLRASFGDSNVQ